MTLANLPNLEQVNVYSASDSNRLPESLLRAVHRPLRFEDGQSEIDLLNSLLGDGPIALIAGPPGSGKAHCLRWLDWELRSRDFEVVRIRAGAAAAIHEFAPKSASTPVRVTKEELRDRLIVRLEQEQQQAQVRTAAARQSGFAPDPVDRDVAGWLAKGLCDLFADPVTAKQFLADAMGIIARLAEQFSSGQHTAQFSEDDFLRPDDIRFLEAGRPAQTMLTKLNLASTSQFRAAAAALMNRVVAGIAPAPAKVPAVPPRIFLIEDSRSLDASFLDQLVNGSFRAAIVDRHDEFSRTGVPGVRTWRLVGLSTADPEEILDFAAAYLAAVRGPFDAGADENRQGIDEEGRSRSGKSLFPFRRPELLAALVGSDAASENSIVPRTLLERLAAALDLKRESLTGQEEAVTEAAIQEKAVPAVATEDEESAPEKQALPVVPAEEGKAAYEEQTVPMVASEEEESLTALAPEEPTPRPVATEEEHAVPAAGPEERTALAVATEEEQAEAAPEEQTIPVAAEEEKTAGQKLDLDPIIQRASVELDRAWREASASLKQAEFLKEHGLLRQRDIPKSTALAKSLAEVKQLTGAAAADLPESKPFRTLLRHIERFANSLRTKIDEAWRSWLTSWTPTTDEEQLARLTALPEHSAFSQSLDERRRQASDLAKVVPQSIAELAQAQRVLTELKEAVAQIPRMLEESEVQAFLAAAGAGEASLRLLTDGVLRWLRENDRSEAFRVVPASPATMQDEEQDREGDQQQYQDQKHD